MRLNELASLPRISKTMVDGTHSILHHHSHSILGFPGLKEDIITSIKAKDFQYYYSAVVRADNFSGSTGCACTNGFVAWFMSELSTSQETALYAPATCWWSIFCNYLCIHRGIVKAPTVQFVFKTVLSLVPNSVQSPNTKTSNVCCLELWPISILYPRRNNFHFEETSLNWSAESFQQQAQGWAAVSLKWGD